MKIIESILTKNPCYQTGRKIKVKGLMLHSVGCNQPSASVFIRLWNTPSQDSVCVHGFIDANTGDVYQTLPWDHRGWHGGGSSNDTHIGVEMCEPSQIHYTSGANFTCSDVTAARKAVERTYNSAVELFAFLCEKYNLNPMKDICSHYEGGRSGIASGHADPEHLWNQLNMGYTMNGFRSDVQKKMKNPSGTSTEAVKGSVTPFTVKLTADSTSYYNAPEGAVCGSAPKGVYTIVEVNGSWGKLKSGAGWIKLNTSKTDEPSKKTIEEIAKEVIRGSWGNGSERRRRLTEAGYDYDLVQNMVNQLI